MSFRGNLDSAGPATNHVGANPALNDGLACLNFARALVIGRDNSIGNNLLFANVHVRFFLRR
jgi:hypothetical protein